MSSLIEGQAAFLKDVVKLLQKADDLGFVITGGELMRTAEQQQVYMKTGRSKTMASEHLNRRAIDLNVFKRKLDGALQLCTRDEIKPLGDYWEGLHALNRWGGNWRGLVDSGKSHFVDAPHFERREG